MQMLIIAVALFGLFACNQAYTKDKKALVESFIQDVINGTIGNNVLIDKYLNIDSSNIERLNTNLELLVELKKLLKGNTEVFQYSKIKNILPYKIEDKNDIENIYIIRYGLPYKFIYVYFKDKRIYSFSPLLKGKTIVGWL